MLSTTILDYVYQRSFSHFQLEKIVNMVGYGDEIIQEEIMSEAFETVRLNNHIY